VSEAFLGGVYDDAKSQIISSLTARHQRDLNSQLDAEDRWSLTDKPVSKIEFDVLNFEFEVKSK